MTRTFGPHIDAADTVLRDWLGDPDLTLVCGRWGDGAIMELMPEGRAALTLPRYEGEFAGLRDLELDGQAHHLHLDLALFTRVVYLVAPSVCFGFRPSFELRFCADEAHAARQFGLGMSLRRPYRGANLNHEPVRRYLRRLAAHRRRFPEVVCVRASDEPVPGAVVGRRAADWAAVGRCVAEELGVEANIGSAPDFTAAVESALRAAA